MFIICSTVCLFMYAPYTPHITSLKGIIRYSHDPLHYGLHLYSNSTHNLLSYTDDDWGGCSDTRRSTSLCCVYLRDNLISWFAKCQPTLSLLLLKQNIVVLLMLSLNLAGLAVSFWNFIVL